MKKFYLFGILVFAAFALVGCAKELSETKEGVETHKVTFTIQQGIDTRTTFEERDGMAHYKWTADDKPYFHLFENGVEGTITDDDIIFDANYEKVTITATFTGSEPDTPSYTAKYAKVLDNGMPQVPAEQYPDADSFDAGADILVSVDAITHDGDLMFTFTREVSINKITLTGLSGKNINYVSLIPKSGSAGFADGCDSLKLNYNGAAAGDNFDVYFTCIPSSTARDYKIRVVATDGSMYYRDNLSTRTFDTDKFRRFSIALANYAVVPAATPTISLASGYIKTGTTHSVTLTSATEGATIYYTTDGNDPTISSSQYSGPISVSSSQTIKAIATKENFLNSAVAKEKYVVIDDYTLNGTITGGTDSFTTESDITQNGVSWKVKGNTTESPWRFGGGNTGLFPVYCYTPIRGAVKEIQVSYGVSGATLKSTDVYVASNDSFSSAYSHNVPSSGSSVTPGNDENWNNCFYKIVFNITKSQNQGKYVTLSSAKFYVEDYSEGLIEADL